MRLPSWRNPAWRTLPTCAKPTRDKPFGFFAGSVLYCAPTEREARQAAAQYARVFDAVTHVVRSQRRKMLIVGTCLPSTVRGKRIARCNFKKNRRS